MNARHRALRIYAGLLVAILVLIGGCGEGGHTTSAAPSSAAPATALPPAAPGEVHLFGINDLHGYLEPPTGSNGRIGTVTAGGAVYLAAHLARLKAAYPASAVLSAGDNISGSPLVSALFHDEPSIEFLNSIGTAAAAVGNHEFDHGVPELTRLIRGGCAADGCSPGAPYPGASFPYLAANVTDATGALPPGTVPWTMLDIGGHKIGVIGAVTPTTTNLVLPEGIRGYSFGDEADAVNRYVPQARAAGAQTVVALVHDGGAQQTRGAPVDYNGCVGISPGVTTLAQRLDPAISVVFTAHTHQAYNCTIAGKVVTQAASYGRLISDVTLRFHDGTVDASAVNRPVTRDIAADPAATKLVNFFADQARPRADRVLGTATAPLPNAPTPAGDSPLGDVIADSMLAATGPEHTVAAFMNPGGVRADLAGGAITYEQAYTVQPFGNQVVAVTLTGRQLLTLLEQQWDNTVTPGVLSVAGLTYAYDGAAPKGHKILTDTVRVAGQPLNPDAAYPISTNNFLAAGGDGFSEFTRGTPSGVGPTDLEAFESYLRTRSTIGPPTDRVQRR